MFDIKTVEIDLDGKTLKLETGRVARQANGAVIATLGETVVLCAVTAAKSVKPGQDFFPLTVHYQEKYSAAGRIPGGFFKRERGATEKETLTSRLIDRPIRPLFPEGFYNEVLVIAQVLSYDGENEPDIVAMIAASAALTISGVPFMGPIGAARVGYVDGEYILNPTNTQVAEGDLDLVVAGTHDAVMMVESEAKELSEDVMLGAVMFAHARQRQGRRRHHPASPSRPPRSRGSFPSDTDSKADQGQAARAHRRRHRAGLQAGRQGRARRPRSSPRAKAPLQGRSRRRRAGPRHQGAASWPRSSKPTSSAARSSRTAAASTAATPRRFARSRRWSASCRAPTVRRCSPAAKRRRSAPPRWAPRTAEQMIDGLDGLSLPALHAAL